MASMRRAHPEYSESRVKAEFYATANKRNQKPKKKQSLSDVLGDAIH